MKFISCHCAACKSYLFWVSGFAVRYGYFFRLLSICIWMDHGLHVEVNHFALQVCNRDSTLTSCLLKGALKFITISSLSLTFRNGQLVYF